MIGESTARRVRIGGFRASVASLAVVALFLAPGRAGALEPPELGERRFTVMSYNVYLGANLQPLFVPDLALPELIDRARTVFEHLDQVDFRVRAVALAEQIIEQQPGIIALQEVSLWQTAPLPAGTPLRTRYDFLEILLDELERQGHPYEAVVVNETFNGRLPIGLAPPTLGVFTDRNVIIARSDLPVSELMASNPMDGVYAAALPPVTIGGTPVRVTRGWASADFMIRGKTYRLFNAHFEAFNSLVRAAQVNELVQIMSESPYPVVLAGDLNVYPQGMRAEDAAAWTLLSGAGFVDAWVVAECFEPRFTAGQTDDLVNVPSILDNTVDYVLYDADLEIEAVKDSCDIAGEELDDRTDTVPALWPSDHAAVVVEMHIARP
jgi:endonuclease/exonuclease/phosphatase family metal-dependent hydrolase